MTPQTTSMSLDTLVTLSSTDFSDSQDETSEAFIGEWAEKRGIRDQLVIATKVRFIVPLFFIDMLLTSFSTDL